MNARRGARIAWRVLSLAQWREQPLRVITAVLAISLGVALGAAVYLINTASLMQFEQATRHLLGDADIVVRGPASGFDESVFVTLAQDQAVSIASPVLELDVDLARAQADRATLKVLALDPLRALALQPQLVGALAGDITALFAHDAIVLSRAAASALGLQRADVLSIVVGGTVRTLRIIDVLPEDAYPQALGIMDIGAAQWTLARLGKLNRVDLQLRPGVDTRSVRARLGSALPAGVFALTPQIERGRAATVTRAYRVNLDVLALVALLTGAFLIFSTQWLSVLRRRMALGLLRALGVTRNELRLALLAESAVIGLAGSVLGVLLGAGAALLMLRYLGADLGSPQYAALGAVLRVHAGPLLCFVLIGTGAACAGGALPAFQAAQRAPALALKAGDAEQDLSRLRTTLPGVALSALGALLAWLPPTGGLPIAGYFAIAALLFGSVLLVPAVTRRALASIPASGRLIFDTALAQLRGSPASASVSLSSIIVSFSLMVAMAIMVHSFRASFELWLTKLLPADLQLRLGEGDDSAALSVPMQARIAVVPGVARVEFRRLRPILLQAGRVPVTLIARDMAGQRAADALPLLREAPLPALEPLAPAWISEAVQDLYGLRAGESLELPLDGRNVRFFIAGIWRDYVRSAGAIVIRREDYLHATGDSSANYASIWRQPDSSEAAIAAQIRATLGVGAALEIISSPELRERSLMAFDRAFVITYALEAVAVLIGLLGVSVAASSTALARRAQFGMLRHIGMLRAQVLWMLASEGAILSALAVLYGLLLGGLLSLILVYVINRQSFNWSIDLSVPWLELAALGAALIAASALTALWSGRAAMSQDPIRAVREDW
ncbi:MAG: FtsX-like permease family protein [Steroidobacteraceae bacterium]